MLGRKSAFRNRRMNQADLDLRLSAMWTCRPEFQDQLERMVPLAALVQMVAPHVPWGRKSPQLRARRLLTSMYLKVACARQIALPLGSRRLGGAGSWQ